MIIKETQNNNLTNPAVPAFVVTGVPLFKDTEDELPLSAAPMTAYQLFREPPKEARLFGHK